MEAQFKCPGCNRPLISRHHKHCQYCGVELPEHLLLKPEEIEAERRALDRAEKQRQIRQADADADEAARRASIDSSTGDLGLL